MNAESLTAMVEHMEGDARLLDEWALMLARGTSMDMAAQAVYKAAWQIRDAADTLRSSATAQKYSN